MSSERAAATRDDVRRARQRYALVIHLCAVVAVLATAARGRFPFVPAYDPGAATPPSWLGLTTTWLIVVTLYLAVWWFASRGGRIAEVALFLAMLLTTLWAAWSLVVALLQLVGLAQPGIRFTATWWLQVLTAAAVSVAMGLLLRVRQLDSDDDDAPDDDLAARHDGISLPAPLPAFSAAVVGVAVVGWVLNAWGLALLDPPSASPDQAVAAVTRAMADVPADAILAFQSGVADGVEREARVHPRDRWHIVEGIVASDTPADYSPDLYWPTQVSYREQLTCVTAHATDKRIVVLPGSCPR